MRVLGPVQIVDEHGAVTDPPSVSQRRLLAVLALNARRTMRADYLSDLLGVSSGALRTTVSRLRRTAGDGLVRSDPIGYRLDADVDADVFATLVAGTGEPGHLARIDRALSLWHGDALDEFAHEAWAAADAARLGELRAVALERRAAALIDLRRFGEAVAELDVLVARHPWRDGARRLLMEALADDGRHTEALHAYREYRDFLAENAGAAPSDDARRLAARLVRERLPH
ncbi:MAG: hypothetical protein H0U21_16970 [Acidimicrobiia bacterium]|nr:hypothetical protein [Acidimicrobiia bacterium]